MSLRRLPAGEALLVVIRASARNAFSFFTRARAGEEGMVYIRAPVGEGIIFIHASFGKAYFFFSFSFSCWRCSAVFSFANGLERLIFIAFCRWSEAD